MQSIQKDLRVLVLVSEVDASTLTREQRKLIELSLTRIIQLGKEADKQLIRIRKR